MIAESLQNDGVGIDSMASVHVTGNRAMLTSVESCAPLSVVTADGMSIVCSRKGTMHLRLPRARDGSVFNVRIPEVYLNDRLKASLLSIGVLVKDGWKLSLSKDDSKLTTPKGTDIKLCTKGSVHLLPLAPNEMLYAIVQQDANDPAVRRVAEQLFILHAALGHPGFHKMREMVRSEKCHGLLSNRTRQALSDAAWSLAMRAVMECRSCAAGKGTSNPVGHRGLDRGSAPCEVLHCDTNPFTSQNTATHSHPILLLPSTSA